MDWFYGLLNSEGILVDRDGHRLLSENVKFTSEGEAEQYCIDQDYRITVGVDYA